MNLIEKLSILMKKNNIKNTSQLSKLTGIPYTTLKSIFDGDVNDIRLSTSRKLCDYFHITLDDLLDDDIELPNTLHYPTYDGINAKDLEELNEEDIKEINRFVEFIKNKKRNDK